MLIIFMVYIVFITIPLILNETVQSQIEVEPLKLDFALPTDNLTLTENDILSNITFTQKINQIFSPKYGIRQSQFNLTSFF